MRITGLLIIALVALQGCATTSSEACQRVERCMRRCQEAGTLPENRLSVPDPNVAQTRCERQCGGCTSIPRSQAQPAPAKKPTFTGN